MVWKDVKSSQIARERYLVLSYIRHESTSVPKLFTQVEKLVDLFDRGIHAGLIRAEPETQVSIENLKWKLAKVRSEGASHFAKFEKVRSVLPSPNSESLASQTEALNELSWQLTQAEEIQDDLSDAVEAELENLTEPQETTRILSFNQGIWGR